jgi:hypothetical protein
MSVLGGGPKLAQTGCDFAFWTQTGHYPYGAPAINAASETMRPFQTALISSSADDALPVSNEVIEKIKNLRCDRHRIRSPAQFAIRCQT